MNLSPRIRRTPGRGFWLQLFIAALLTLPFLCNSVFNRHLWLTIGATDWYPQFNIKLANGEVGIWARFDNTTDGEPIRLYPQLLPSDHFLVERHRESENYFRWTHPGVMNLRIPILLFPAAIMAFALWTWLWHPGECRQRLPRT